MPQCRRQHARNYMAHGDDLAHRLAHSVDTTCTQILSHKCNNSATQGGDEDIHDAINLHIGRPGGYGDVAGAVDGALYQNVGQAVHHALAACWDADGADFAHHLFVQTIGNFLCLGETAIENPRQRNSADSLRQ